MTRGAGAALHRPAPDERGVADPDAPAEPGVLDVRLATVELNEHAEAASIDRLAGDLAQPVDGPLPEQRERLDVVAAQRIGALDQLERTTGPLGKDGGEGAVDDTTWSSAEGEEVRVDCFAQAHLVVGEDGVTFPQGEAARRGVVLRRDAHECTRLGDRDQ